MAEDNRPSVKLASWNPPQKYNQPHLEPSGGIRTKKHEVLGDQTVVQGLGEEAEEFTLRGDAYARDLRELRSFKNEIVTVRHPVHSGDVLVSGVSGGHTGSWDTVDGERLWVYSYIVDLISQ